MTECSFLPVFFETHQSRKYNKPAPEYENFDSIENIWLNFYEMGKYEIYHFLYAECKDLDHFKQWLIALKGSDFLIRASANFQTWFVSKDNKGQNDGITHTILSEEQLLFWETQGYLKISGLVEDSLCDQVKELICSHMGVDLDNPATWYYERQDMQGLMLQLYQSKEIEAIRKHPHVFELFAELYQTRNIIANTEKLGFNPPDTDFWQLKQTALHWDIDLNKPLGYYIQGMIYLDDVPADRGAFSLVPGIHLQFEDWIKSFRNLEDAHIAMRAVLQAQPIAGDKGDIILWRHTLPHAASTNRSQLPRFVQYLSFSKL
ncbi:Phytanoyl-CoA dioxygenase (PhyH) [Pedobacter sp. ok626]|uniref:phytanoyl-CoA dioxygenase family protein n=1 Tax=Pedobacter sp. ok626 TaxID=1761882 RepID=UPI000890E0AF|nr:phytanoyl-CoA dioxygenase family protein [Pedobacter sp. ok626]SDL79301.1 Phytanoyl-CoA dioxygenase (PhyH) [Pedobacter sp. ok626]